MVNPEEWVKESFEQSLTQIFFVISPQLNKKVTILKCEIETSKGPIFYGTNFVKDDEQDSTWNTLLIGDKSLRGVDFIYTGSKKLNLMN